jgi:coenzyme PQQ precursor peptide PqqA
MVKLRTSGTVSTGTMGSVQFHRWLEHVHRITPMQRDFERSATMSWEKPQAVDFRFGFEITMYIANR